MFICIDIDLHVLCKHCKKYIKKDINYNKVQFNSLIPLS